MCSAFSAGSGPHLPSVGRSQDMAAPSKLKAHSEMACIAGCCDPCNEKALRASRGAAFKVPLAQGDWQVQRQLLIRFRVHMQCIVTFSTATYAEKAHLGTRSCCTNCGYCDGLQGLDEAAQHHSLAYVGAEPHEEAQSTAESSPAGKGMLIRICIAAHARTQIQMNPALFWGCTLLHGRMYS